MRFFLDFFSSYMTRHLGLELTTLSGVHIEAERIEAARIVEIQRLEHERREKEGLEHERREKERMEHERLIELERRRGIPFFQSNW